MAKNLVYRNSDLQNRVQSLSATYGAGVPVISLDGKPAVTVTASGDHTRTDSTSFAPLTISGIPDGGVGLVGKELFQADCAMCHGMNADGAPPITKSLLIQNYEDPKTYERLRAVIANGSPNTPEMPPFAKERGGPLNSAEIDSLIRFLKYQSNLDKTGQLERTPKVEEEPEDE